MKNMEKPDGLYLHVTDYDDTIMPKESENIPELCKANAKTYRDFVKKNPNLKVIYSTGRTTKDILGKIRQYRLPKPEYIIGCVGAEIYDYRNKKFVEGWKQLMDRDGFDRAKVSEVLSEMNERKEKYSSKYKAYYHLINAKKSDIAGIRQKLKASGIYATVNYSRMKNVEIVPAKADKGKAIAYIAKMLGIKHDRIAISGDSNNDYSMFKRRFGLKILPKNAEPALKLKVADIAGLYASKHDCAFAVVDGLKKFITL